MIPLQLIGCLLLLGIPPTDGAPPNIVILLVDDLGFNDVGFHGSPEILTPTIDSLAQNGTILSRHYTTPYCTPSRASLMTGRYPINIGMQSLIVDPDISTGLPLNVSLMSNYLKNIGYSTHALGKWHLGYSYKEYTPTYRGFDTFLGSYTSGVDHFTHLRPYREMQGVDFHDDIGETLTCTLNFHAQHSTDILSERASEIILDHDFAKSPVFIYLAFQAVHEPYQAKSEDLKFFKDVYDLDRLQYIAAMKSVDDGIRLVVESLESRGVMDNTIILFSSDNGGPTGPGSNFPLRAGKGYLFEGGVRVPAFVLGPEIPPGRVFSSYIHLSDWLPTMYAAAGADVSQLGPLDGINQWPALTDVTLPGPRSEILLNIITDEYGLIDGDYKLVACWGNCEDKKYEDGWNFYEGPRNESDVNRIESRGNWTLPLVHCNRREQNLNECKIWTENEEACLFNIKSDPCELDNIASQNQEMVSTMKQKLEEYRKNMLEPIPSTRDSNVDPKYYDGFWVPWL